MNVICDCLRKHQNGGVCDCLDNSDWDNHEEDWEDGDVEVEELDIAEEHDDFVQ